MWSVLLFEPVNSEFMRPTLTLLSPNHNCHQPTEAVVTYKPPGELCWCCAFSKIIWFSLIAGILIECFSGEWCVCMNTFYIEVCISINATCSIVWIDGSMDGYSIVICIWGRSGRGIYDMKSILCRRNDVWWCVLNMIVCMNVWYVSWCVCVIHFMYIHIFICLTVCPSLWGVVSNYLHYHRTHSTWVVRAYGNVTNYIVIRPNSISYVLNI